MDTREIIAKGKSYQEAILFTDNTRLAATFLVFGAALLRNCPLEWIDIHQSKFSFLKNLEDPSDPKYQPKPKVTFNFQSGTVPEAQIVQAFEAEYNLLQAAFEEALTDVNSVKQEVIRNAVSRLIARACHEVLLRREELVRLLKRVPQNAKFDQIRGNGQRLIRMGKNSSSELRKHFLSKI